MKPNDKALDEALDEALSVTQIPEESTREYMRRILTAAYAAQFKSEEYADLIRSLRGEPPTNSTLDPLRAADALEALVAERDMLREENENIKAANRYGKDWVDQASQEITSLRAERDALLARLAPVDDDALVKIVADAISDGSKNIARAAIAAIRPHIEAAEMERCAKIAEKYENEKANYLLDPSARAVATLWRGEIAAAIRRGK